MGDWCWDMEPFQVTAETKAMVQENIAFLLGQFLRCSAYETVIFCWVMHQREIIQELSCPPAPGGRGGAGGVLAGHGGDAASAHRQGCGRGPAHLGRAGAQPPAAALYQDLPTEKLWVDDLTPQQAAQRLAGDRA